MSFEFLGTIYGQPVSMEFAENVPESDKELILERARQFFEEAFKMHASVRQIKEILY